MSATIRLCVVFAGATLLMSTQCRKELTIEYKYKLLEKIDLAPFQKVYYIGDTIWLQYTNPNKAFYDQTTRQKVFSDTFSLPFAAAYNSRYQAPQNRVDSFCSFITMNAVTAGVFMDVNGESVLIGTNCPANYAFALAIVPKQTGIYSLDLSVPQIVGSCNGNIPSSIISTIEYRFNLTDCNKDVYLSIPASARGESKKGYTESLIDSRQVFVFRVAN